MWLSSVCLQLLTLAKLTLTLTPPLPLPKGLEGFFSLQKNICPKEIKLFYNIPLKTINTEIEFYMVCETLV